MATQVQSEADVLLVAWWRPGGFDSALQSRCARQNRGGWRHMGMKWMTGRTQAHWQEFTGCSGRCSHTSVTTLGFVQIYVFMLISCWGWGIPEGRSRLTGAHLTPGCSLPSLTSWGRVCGILFKGVPWERRHCGEWVLEERRPCAILICTLSYMTRNFWKKSTKATQSGYCFCPFSLFDVFVLMLLSFVHPQLSCSGQKPFTAQLRPYSGFLELWLRPFII